MGSNTVFSVLVLGLQGDFTKNVKSPCLEVSELCTWMGGKKLLKQK